MRVWMCECVNVDICHHFTTSEWYIKLKLNWGGGGGGIIVKCTIKQKYNVATECWNTVYLIYNWILIMINCAFFIVSVFSIVWPACK